MQRPRSKDIPRNMMSEKDPLRRSSSVFSRSTGFASLLICLVASADTMKQFHVDAFTLMGSRQYSTTMIRRTNTSPLRMIEKAMYEVDANGNPMKTYSTNVEAQESSDVMEKRIVNLLSDDHGEEDDEVPDYSEEAANEIADKRVYSRISEEAKWKANSIMQKNVQINSIKTMNTSSRISSGLEPMIEKRVRTKPPTKVMASVTETGGDSMSAYIKSMGQHELLPQESELLLGKHIQLLVKWEVVRSKLEKELNR